MLNLLVAALVLPIGVGTFDRFGQVPYDALQQLNSKEQEVVELLQRGRYQDVLKRIPALQAQSPKNLMLLKAECDAQLGQRSLAQFIDRLEKVVARDRASGFVRFGHAETWYQLAVGYGMLRRMPPASNREEHRARAENAAYRACVTWSQGGEIPLPLLLVYEEESGANPADARNWLRAYVKAHPGNLAALAALCDSAMRGRPGEAFTHDGKGKIIPVEIPPMDKMRPDLLRSWTAEAEKHHPEWKLGSFFRGVAAHAEGNRAEAIGEFQQFVRLGVGPLEYQASAKAYLQRPGWEALDLGY